MSEQMKKTIKDLCNNVSKLDDTQQTAISLIAQGMALQKELSEEEKEAVKE